MENVHGWNGMGAVGKQQAGTQAVLFLIREIQGLAAVSGQDAARRIEDACLRKPMACLHCGSERFYRLGGGRIRCRDCRYTFRLLTGRWMGRIRIPAAKWLLLIKCFELGLNGPDARMLTKLSRPTIYRAYEMLRKSLAASDRRAAALVPARSLGPQWGLRNGVGFERLLDSVTRYAPVGGAGEDSLTGAC